MAKELDMQKYAKMFVSESRENLRVMNEAMLQLEKDHSDKELVNQMFRSCHTIKGMAGMMAMQALVDLAHSLEGVLGAVRDNRLTADKRIDQLIFEGIDALETMVSSVENSEPLTPNEELIVRLKEVAASATGPAVEEKKKPVAKGKAKASQRTSVLVKLNRKCSLPSARAMVIIKELKKAARIAATTPAESDIDKEKAFEELVVELVPSDKFPEALRRVAFMTDVDEVAYGPAGSPREEWQRVQKQQASKAGAGETGQAQSVRVSMDKLDDLLDDVGELVIGRSRLLEKASEKDDFELSEITSGIDKLVSGIQERVLGIRMIPLDIVMSRFPRMVRDMGVANNKEVELVVEGGGIELDRTVVDRITDPMMHLLRNCVDHGIEPTEERVKQGKHPKGLIRIVASKQQDHVLIEVSDDGRGIDIETVKKAAVKKGMMTQQEADSALGRDLIALLFGAGFSTKAEVTEVSGRGVGLDVVKKAVEDLGGSVMVTTSKGAGTTFSLWLPFTLAIIEAMLVKVADQTYAVPMGGIIESHSFDSGEIKQIRGREVVQLRGEVLPLIRMRNFFGLEQVARSGGINTLIVQSRDRRAALQVDELMGHQQIVVKSLDRFLRKAKGISGGTILGSGGIALILDVDSILGG